MTKRGRERDRDWETGSARIASGDTDNQRDTYLCGKCVHELVVNTSVKESPFSESRPLFYTILYYTIVHTTTLYYTILYYTIYTILYYTILYYTTLYSSRRHGELHRLQGHMLRESRQLHGIISASCERESSAWSRQQKTLQARTAGRHTHIYIYIYVYIDI